jgi:hypothetical protein
VMDIHDGVSDSELFGTEPRKEINGFRLKWRFRMINSQRGKNVLTLSMTKLYDDKMYLEPGANPTTFKFTVTTPALYLVG